MGAFYYYHKYIGSTVGWCFAHGSVVGVAFGIFVDAIKFIAILISVHPCLKECENEASEIISWNFRVYVSGHLW